MSESTLGNAAHHVLAGDIDSDGIDLAIDRCHRCSRVNELTREWEDYCRRYGRNPYPGRTSWYRNPSCWHLEARLLWDQGLRPVEVAASTAVENGQLALEEA